MLFGTRTATRRPAARKQSNARRSRRPHPAVRRLFVEQLEDRRVMTAAAIAAIPVGSWPVGLAGNPVISRTYVANNDSGTVSVIDDATNTVLSTINLGAGTHPGTMGVDPSTNRVFVVQGNTAAADDTVAVIDGTPGSPTENTVVATIPVSGRYLAGATTMAVNPTTHRVYIPSFDPGGQVVVIDGVSNSLLSPISVAANPFSAAYDSVHNRVYLGHGSFFLRSQLTIIDADTHAVSNGPNVGIGQYDLGVNPDTNTLYVHKGDPSRGSPYGVAVVDTVTNTVTTTIPEGASAFGGVGVDASAGRIYVADSTLDAVRIIDGASGSPTLNTILGTVAVGDQPTGVGVNSALGRVFVANAAGNTVSVIADVVYPPVADAGGPYTVAEGGSVQLDATGTTDADLPNDLLTYAWDFDGDGQYDDAVGLAPWFSAAELDGPTMVSVGLRVTDAARASNIDTVAITVTNVAPRVTIGGAPANSPEGAAITLTSTVADPGVADQAAGFTYAWSVTKDGAAYAAGNQANLTFRPNDNATYVVSLVVTDQDGASSPEAVCVFEDGAEAGRFRLGTPPLADHGYQFTLTELSDGRLLVVGGNPQGTVSPVAEIYDPRTGTWSLTGSLSVGRGGHSATLLHDGRVLIAGGSGAGQTLASAELFDPQTGTFSPVESMGQARQGHSAFVLDSGLVLVVAGGANVGYDTLGLASAELFDPASGTWTPTGSLNIARMGQAGTLLADGRPLVAGGMDRGVTFQNFDSAEVYDPVSGSWSLTANPMLTARRGAFSLTTLPSGLVLAAGGVTNWTGPPTANAELFDPATGVWTSTTSLPAAVGDHTATLLEDGKVLIAGGLRSGTYLDTGYVFDPATELWTATPNPLIHARGYHAGARLPGGPVLLMGGWNGATTVPSAEIYGASRGIYNVSPTVNAGTDATVRPGVTFTQTGSFTDPGADTWSATVDYGDGSGVQPLTLGADKTFTLNHVFPAGNYTAPVTVTVTDDDGDSGVDTFVVVVDNLPPTVTGITPSLAATGTLAGNATSLAITFSESMTGGAAAGNFQLRSLGPDALLGTADDITVALTASYAGTTTTLSFSPLSAGVYRLTIRDAITDVAGNPLDGDGNGAAGGDWGREFVVLPAGGPLLGPSTTYGTGGTNPYSVTHADFNGDGKLDLAIGNTGSSDVGVLWGDGAGGFSEAAIFPSGGAGANAVAAADFNGDGKPDLATTRSGSDNRVAVLLNDGAGGFLQAVAYPAGGTGTWAIAVADLNRDGKKDLVVANGGSDTVGILLGNGAGGFADAVTYASCGYDATDLAVGDFNGDGNTDVAITNHASRNVGVLLGNGTGVFSPVTTYPTVDVTHTVTAADFNGDGKDDLVVTNWFNNRVRVLLASDTGFTTAGTYPIGGTGPSCVRTGDFNGDGTADLVVAIENNRVAVLLGDGTGAFAAAEVYGSTGAGFRMTVADFNADGRADLAVNNPANNTVGVLLNADGPATLHSPHGFPIDVQFGGFMAGQLVQGPSNAFDGLNRLQVDGLDYAPALTAPVQDDAGRTVVTGTQTLSGLQVHREITVPGTGSEDFARTIDSFINTSDGPITATIRIVGNLGSDDATRVWTTSDGDPDVEPTDQWIGTDDADGNGSPAIIHYIHGPEGLLPSAVRISGDRGDNLEWTYELTVPAGQTVRLAHFAILADTRAAAEAAAAALITPFWFGAESDAFLSLEELESVANFQFPKDSTVFLPTTGSRNEVIVRLNGSDLEVLDNLGQVTAFSQPLRHAHSLSVIGVDDVNDRVTVDYDFGGFFELLGGLQIDGGVGGADTLVVRGDWRTLGRYLSDGGWGAATLDTSGGAGRTQIAFSGIEPLTIEQFRALEFVVDGVLDVGAQTLTIHASMLTGLDWLTSLGDGAIVASQGLALDAGEGLEGRGVVSGRIAAGIGSTIRASGDLQLGDASSLAGFFSDGELHAGANRVTILDANKGVLGSLTVLGDETGPGTLTAPNGLILEEAKALSGQGEINTPGGQFKNNGYVHSEAGGLVFNHLVTGIGDFGGPTAPVFNGGYSPGLSPAQIDFLGGVVFTDTNVLVIEIGGRNPGDEFDRLDVAGTASLDGTLAVSLIDGFIPAAGDRFEVITAAGGVAGTFDTETLPALSAGLEWAVVYGSDGVALVVNPVVPQTLVVTGLVPTPSGCVASFSRALDPSVLNLYDGAQGGLGAADATVVDARGVAVRGSLVMDANRRQVTFIKTGGLLEPDTYTVTLFSGATRFREPGGGTLDGNADGAPGDHYQTSFTVPARPAGTVTISLPDVARGAGQPVNVPNATAGLPIRISDAAGVTSLAVDVVHDAALWNVTGVVLAAGLPGDWSVSFDGSTPGVAKFVASGTTALTGSNVEVVRLTAAVPGDALYGASQAVRLENVSINGGAIFAVGDVAVHKTAYLGDADGSGIHSSADAFLTVQAALGLATGFSAHAWTDPRIVGDADGSGVLSAADAFLIVQEGLGLSEPFVPDNPHVTVTPVGGGVDPRFQIGAAIPAFVGGWVSVPVHLDIEPGATNVGGIDFGLFFDPSQLAIELPVGVSAGADAAGAWAVSSTPVAAGHLRVGMVNSRGQPLAPGRREIARLLFRVDGSAADGSAALDIEPVDPHAGGYAWTASDGRLLIGPAPPELVISEILYNVTASAGFGATAGGGSSAVAIWQAGSPDVDEQTPQVAGWESRPVAAKLSRENLEEGLFREPETELSSLEDAISDVADDIAAVWRFDG